jgi:NAD-dependent deacetylase
MDCRPYPADGRRPRVADGLIPPALLDTLQDAHEVAVLTGAGVSAESGVPTFRDALTGLWANFRPEDLATPEAFAANPSGVWDWYQSRRAALTHVKPNAGHVALAELQALFPRFTLITQNVDGLHAAAGSQSVVELHGNLSRNKCFGCNDPEPATQPTDKLSPCACGRSVKRPDVVWFNENLPEAALTRAQVAAERCDVFFSIGTSAQVYPAADLPRLAKAHGATVVEINAEPTPLTRTAHYSLLGKSGEVLPALVRALRERA